MTKHMDRENYGAESNKISFRFSWIQVQSMQLSNYSLQMSLTHPLRLSMHLHIIALMFDEAKTVVRAMMHF